MKMLKDFDIINPEDFFGCDNFYCLYDGDETIAIAFANTLEEAWEIIEANNLLVGYVLDEEEEKEEEPESWTFIGHDYYDISSLTMEEHTLPDFSLVKLLREDE